MEETIRINYAENIRLIDLHATHNVLVTLVLVLPCPRPEPDYSAVVNVAEERLCRVSFCTQRGSNFASEIE